MNKRMPQVLLCMVLPVLALQLSSSSSPLPRYYSAADLGQELQARQDQLGQKMTTLEKQLKAIDALVQDSSVSISTKIMKLQEGMAEERDQLNQIQQFLKVPFRLKKCECRTLTANDQQTLADQIAAAQHSLTGLKAELASCETETACAKSTQLAAAAQNIESYLAQIKEVFYSECCRARQVFAEESPTGMTDLQNSLFKDNLQAKNWYYGATTEDEYRLKMFEISTKFNTKNCPIETPYAVPAKNACMKCEQEGAMFNLGARQCFHCGGGKYLNEANSLCESCPARTKYNPQKKMCEKCPAGLVLNTVSNACELCQTDKGEFYSVNEEACKKCGEGQAFDQKSKQCRECNATAAQFLNRSTFQCEFCPKAEFYNSTSRACEKCGNNAYFSREKGACLSCPLNQEFDTEAQQCQECATEEYFSTEKLKCEICPKGQSYNQQKLKCRCPTDKPAYNQERQVCEACPSLKTWDEREQQCINHNNIGLCPHDKPFYNISTHSCEACPKETAFSEQTYDCQPLRHHLSPLP